MKYYVYILTNSANVVLYIGVTNDIVRRINEHFNGEERKFAARYKTFKLVYNEEFNNPQDAIAREKQLKKWSRKKKIALIETLNPEWDNLLEL